MSHNVQAGWNPGVPSSVTALANPNIALIKYWGKADEELILPAAGSLSLTLNVYPTETQVKLMSELSNDEFFLNGTEQTPEASRGVHKVLGLIRELAGVETRARVVSKNSGPTAAGLASSASGYAALALAASAVYGLELSPKELSRLARRGSGSASRSIFSGLSIWHAGTDAESYAEPVLGSALDLAMTIAEVSKAKKAISSREAMRLTQETSPFYAAWITENALNLNEMLIALRANDFERVGELTEASFYRMTASMIGAMPAIRYFTAESVALLDLVRELRASGIPAYATMDAGPNVKVLSQAEHAPKVRQALATVIADDKLVSALPGLGARVEMVQYQAPTGAAPITLEF
ncbi:MAG: diphosphomevalonate decarboxylase [Microbacteriaceae bacterium]